MLIFDSMNVNDLINLLARCLTHQKENLEWLTSPAVMTETILTAKEFLDAKLGKYETLKEIIAAEPSFSRVFKNEIAFAAAKRKDQKGVGRDTLAKFLGGNWKQ